MNFLSGTEGRFARAALAYMLAGRLRLPGGHRPPAGHAVPEGFAGVGVASAANPAVDDYVLARLGELGIRQVRVDFSYGDADAPAGRLLDRLCGDGYRVMLHLVQPAAEARRMAGDAGAQATWRDFVAGTLDRFGARVASVEVGSTVNRLRWAGYSLDGFLAMWAIAHAEVRVRGLTLAGPSVTDFEPPWNVGLLRLLRECGQLPDIHTNNLFAERATEPERYDHKVLGRRLAPLLRMNLVKKAHLLAKIAADSGVPRLHSPAAFWTLPRIARVLPECEQKQADYLARYLVLCAASGALEAAWWGPLLCHREGLVDDGEAQYPALERITHYAGVAGDPARFRIRPAFHALRTFAALIPGSRYLGSLATGPGLEAHAFETAGQRVHALWTINGRAAALADLYAGDDLAAATCLDRDGEPLATPPSLLGERPLYLCWPAERAVPLRPGAALLPGLVVHLHAPGKRHFLFREDGWQGVVLAGDAAEAARLLQAIDPRRIGAPPRETTLRHARNAIWTIADPRADGARLVVKQPVQMHLHKRLLDRFKPAKGLRSWSGTCELLRRGIDAARPVAYFEKLGDAGLTQNYYLCEYVPADVSAREMVAAFARGEAAFLGVDEAAAWRQLCDFLLLMHGRGIHFRDLSGGNILIRPGSDGRLAFSLIDTGRLHAGDQPLPLGKRLADLVRVCNKMSADGRDRFMALYMAGLGRRFGSWLWLPFAAYDLKVTLKRRVGRKAIKRLLFRT